ncbi:unnamed protein product [Linum trigynum]|uniref:Uncharacterized protein n=1 Tax=Linum trigynum TaxID=586398 RepID=A0AAV2G9G3_9ROSI
MATPSPANRSNATMRSPIWKLKTHPFKPGLCITQVCDERWWVLIKWGSLQLELDIDLTSVHQPINNFYVSNRNMQDSAGLHLNACAIQVEYDDVAMESLSGEDMEVEVDASTSSVGTADIGSTATQIKSPKAKGRKLT